MDFIISLVKSFADFYWEHVGYVLITIAGLYLTFTSKFLQFRVIASPMKCIRDLSNKKEKKEQASRGTSPFKLYFASIGGMIGAGNITGATLIVTKGGPGGIFWLWVASFCGMLIKYSEIYLGMLHRVHNSHNGYDGGLMYYVRDAFTSKFLAIFVAFLFCIYGVEVYQFSTLTHVMSSMVDVSYEYIVFWLLIIVLYVSFGGVNRTANVCSILMPFFIIIYVLVCGYIVLVNYQAFFDILPEIFSTAFTGHAAVGGFAGSTMVIAARYGVSKAVYAGDIGVGYDAVINSESKVKDPNKQAKLAILSLFSDSIICTLTCLVVLVTGIWKSEVPISESDAVKTAFSMYFSYSEYLIGFILFLAIFTTIIAYFVVGQKAAKFIGGKKAVYIYRGYAMIAFTYSAFKDVAIASIIMEAASGLLVLINIAAIFKLRKDIKFV